MAAERTELRSEELGRPFPGTLDHVGLFEVSGVLGDSGAGDTVTVGWKEGEPYGDEATLILLRIEARVFDGVPLGPPTGPFTETAEQHLKSPVTAYILMKNVLSEVSVVKGDVPVPQAVGGRIL